MQVYLFKTLKIDRDSGNYLSIIHQFELMMLNATVIGAMIQFLLELGMWLPIRSSGINMVGPRDYLFKFVLLPSMINFVGICFAFFVFHRRYARRDQVTYAPIISMFTVIFNIYLVHSDFNVPIMFFALPLLVTTLYGSRPLLRIICVLTLLLQEAGYYLSALVSMEDFLNNRGFGMMAFLNNVLFILSVLVELALCNRLVMIEKLKKEMFIVSQNATQTDMLTGLKNRKGLRVVFDQILAGSDADRNFSLIFLDIDHFKQLNDELGHQLGDEYLKALGSVLTEIKGVEAFRYGGDEFCLVAHRDPESCIPICEMIQSSYRNMPVCAHHRFSSLSFGIEGWDGVMTPSEWLQHADAALYEAKKNRGSIVKYDEIGKISMDA